MKVSNKLQERILKDNSFSLHLALLFNVSQRWVQKMAEERNMKLLLPHAMDFYSSHGLSREDVIEKSS